MATIDPQTILNQSLTLVINLESQVQDAIDHLDAFIEGYVTWVDYPPAPVFMPTPQPPIPAENLPVLEKAIFGPEFGDPTAELDKYKSHVFIAPMLDSMQTTLMGWVTSGGVGISDDVQNALWNSNRQRRLQSFHDVIDDIHARDEARGFARFTGTWENYNQNIEYQRNDDDLNWKITAKIADLAQQNVQFAMTSNIAIEQLQSGFSQGMAGIFLNIKKLVIDKFKVECDERIEEFKAQMSIIQAGYQLAEANDNLSVSFQGLLSKQWEVLMTTGTARTQSLIAQAEQKTKIQLEATKALVDTLGSTIQAALLQTNGIVLDSTTTSGGKK